MESFDLMLLLLDIGDKYPEYVVRIDATNENEVCARFVRYDSLSSGDLDCRLDMMIEGSEPQAPV